MTIRHMRIACRLPKATDTHSECVIIITFPPQQRLPERLSVLRYTRISGLVNYLFKLRFSRWWSGNGNHLNQ